MTRLLKIVVAITMLVLSGCGSDCSFLAEEACREHGEDSAVCIARTNELAEPGSERENLCKRALVLYRSLPASE